MDNLTKWINKISIYDDDFGNQLELHDVTEESMYIVRPASQHGTEPEIRMWISQEELHHIVKTARFMGWDV